MTAQSRREFARGSLTGLGTLAAGAGWATAQPPKGKPQAKNRLDAVPQGPDRDLFVVYVIEEFYRDSVPNRPLTEPPGSPGYDRFVKERERLVNNLLGHLDGRAERKPLKDRLGEYRAYLARLSQMNQRLMAADARYRDQVVKLYANVERELNFLRAEYTAFDTLPSMVRSARSARWWRGESPVYLAAVTGYIKSLQTNLRVNRAGVKLFEQARQKEVAFWQTNRDRLDTELRTILADFERDTKEVRAAGLTRLQQTASELAKVKGWKPTEIKIDPDRNPAMIELTTRPRDPFPFVWRARDAARPDVTIPGSVSAAHDAAKASYGARALVPPEDAYLPFKALACEVAGQVALTCAAAECGTGGFGDRLRQAVKEPAETAQAAWTEYRNAVKLDFIIKRPLLMHQLVMAKAYTPGQPRWNAYQLVADHMNRPDLSVTEEPEVWYDFARVCAAQKGTNADARVGASLTAHERAIFALQRARLFGFDRSAEAQASSDFGGLVNGAQWKRQAFTAALNLPIIRATR